MQTLLLNHNEQDIQTAGRLLARGGLVAIPTETVYGLAANALDADAVAKIFKAKGRPMDNPLIVHIAELPDLERFGLVREIPEAAYRLAAAFWPGPLTIIMKKGGAVPDAVSAGLDTVAVRFPSHPLARAVIRAAGVPLAAPSANLSGSPSPTTAQHVRHDLDGRIDAILDGGECQVGLESTVVTLVTEVPRVLRPGGVTVEMLRETLGEVEVDDAVIHQLAEGAKAASPGMKYKHYAPKANVILIHCDDADFINYVNLHAGRGVAVLCCDEDVPLLRGVKAIPLGCRGDYGTQAHRLFDSLRRIDGYGDVLTVFSRLPSTDGVGLAVYNRLIRAAGFEVIELGKS